MLESKEPDNNTPDSKREFEDLIDIAFRIYFEIKREEDRIRIRDFRERRDVA